MALGIAVKTWLDDYAKPNMTSDEKKTLQEAAQTKNLPHGEDFGGDLDMAFNFFNALFDGVKTLATEIPEADFEVWNGARKYLVERH